jgi:hypothetical protein
MGTRARVNVMEGNQVLVSIYRQYDGYPNGLGEDVADFVGGLRITNGISGDPTGSANGMGCLAAQLIKHLKDKVGNVYIRDTGPESNGEEYVYTVYERNGTVYLRAVEGSMTAFGLPGDSEGEMAILYDGPAANFDADQLKAA